MLCDISLRLLLWTAELTPGGAISFQEVALAAYGAKTARFVDLCVFLMCFSAVLAYTIIIGDLLPEVFKAYGAEGVWTRRAFVMAIFAFGAMLPLSLARTMDFLKHTSAAAMACMLYLACVVAGWAVYHKFDDVAAGNVDHDPNVSATPVFFVLGPQLFYALPLFGFAYTSHTQVYQIYHELDNKSVSVIYVCIVMRYQCRRCDDLGNDDSRAVGAEFRGLHLHLRGCVRLFHLLRRARRQSFGELHGRQQHLHCSGQSGSQRCAGFLCSAVSPAPAPHPVPVCADIEHWAV